MESEDQFIDSDEVSERLKQEFYEAQKCIRDAGLVDEEDLYRSDTDKSCLKQEEVQGIDDPAPEGSLQKEILTAAEKGNLDIIEKLLLERSSLIQAYDRDGYTPLHRSSYSNHPNVVKFLLDNGADVASRTCDGWTPLHSACKWNNFSCVKLLLDYGSDINALTNGGQTPLHLASSHPEAKETLILLLTNPKISVNIRNQTGELASELAHRHCKYYKLFEMSNPCFNNI